MRYISTRAKENSCFAAEAIVNGISKDGGLFVPEEFPSITLDELKMMTDMSYEERAAYTLAKFLTDFTYQELLEYTTKAYSRFYGDDPCPVVELDDHTYVLELWHGPTCAFKDMALTVLPHLMSASRAKTGEKNKTLILVATSGDTGKAALEGFKDVDGCEIIVFYPSDGVSDMQKLQMQTQEGNNVYVCAINGNFDDAQSAVKTIFVDKEINKALLEKGYKLSSANSINWGRLAPQIAYYISAYVDLLDAGRLAEGEKVNFCVPSGNFGNILAGYYAMRMGLPVNKLICASNINNVLTEFFESGEYNINREFYKTTSPSMDILISSNLERLLFEVTARDDKAVADMMNALKTDGVYKVDKKVIDKAIPEFVAGFSSEEDVEETIADYDDDYEYLLDPHTAVAMNVYDSYTDNSGDVSKTIIVSTANPYKFAADVYKAVSGNEVTDAFAATEYLNEFTGEEIPEPLRTLKEKKARFKDVVEKNAIKDKVLEVINSKN